MCVIYVLLHVQAVIRCRFTKTYVWDVSNLQQLNLRSIFQSTERSIDHNQYIIGNLAYQASLVIIITVHVLVLEVYQSINDNRKKTDA